MNKIQEIATLIIEIHNLYESIQDAKCNVNFAHSASTGKIKELYKVDRNDFQFESLEYDYLIAKKKELSAELSKVFKVQKQYDGFDSDDCK